MTKCHEYDIHYFALISDDSNETRKKFIYQDNAAIRDGSNEVELSAKKLAFLQQCVDRDNLFEVEVMCYKLSCPVYTKICCLQALHMGNC